MRNCQAACFSLDNFLLSSVVVCKVGNILENRKKCYFVSLATNMNVFKESFKDGVYVCSSQTSGYLVFSVVLF